MCVCNVWNGSRAITRAHVLHINYNEFRFPCTVQTMPRWQCIFLHTNERWTNKRKKGVYRIWLVDAFDANCAILCNNEASIAYFVQQSYNSHWCWWVSHAWVWKPNKISMSLTNDFYWRIHAYRATFSVNWICSYCGKSVTFLIWIIRANHARKYDLTQLRLQLLD